MSSHGTQLAIPVDCHLIFRERIMTPDLYIKNALKEFNVTDTAIAELKNKYSELKISGLEDKQGYAVVRAARLDIKTRRIEVDKKRKELNEVAINHQRQVNAEAKRITALLEPLEDYLTTQEKEFEDEKERFKKEKERLEKEKIVNRIKNLVSIGFVFNGVSFDADYDHFENVFEYFLISIQEDALYAMTDEQFNAFHAKYKIQFDAKNAYLEEEKRLHEELQAKIDAERKAEIDRLEKLRQEQLAKEAEERRIENERLEKIRIAQQAERERLEVIEREQALKEAILKAEKERIEAEKQALAQAEHEKHNYLLQESLKEKIIPESEFAETEVSKPGEIDIFQQNKTRALMTFEQALPFLKAGKRIIRKSLEDNFDQLWLHLNDEGWIDFMNEPWHPSAEQLREDLLANDWINVEEDDDYK